MGMQAVIIEFCRHSGLPGLVAAHIAQQSTTFNNIRPVVFAGVVHTNEHLYPARDLHQCLQTLPGQRTEPEYNDTARKVRPASLFRPLTQCLDEAFMHTSTPGP